MLHDLSRVKAKSLRARSAVVGGAVIGITHSVRWTATRAMYSEVRGSLAPLQKSCRLQLD
ncbi:protein of unknown function [Candidatus Filomicrobium marinum]|uniref:Uncharacterized protein n=1 Tax=Candidatus Filomicrobium marinum TaxID=1608628 RepID=A0A0D6JH43_9HYPH|nr:protein of unknown function [Candidatus Filomicrobium marinum]